jgi:hypothetical protein
MEIWKLSIETLSIVVGALASVYQLWNARFRTQLKSDLDILKSLMAFDNEDENSKILKAHIDYTIGKAYACGSKHSSHTSKTAHINRMDLGFGLLFLILFILWMGETLEFGNTWWRILLAGAFAFSCMLALLNVVHKRGVSQKVALGAELVRAVEGESKVVES